MYSKNWSDHVCHLRSVFETLREHLLYANCSKCLIGQKEVEYLGHFINTQGVATDPKKIKSMQSWSTPTTTIALPVFLGLTGYYRKFIRNYETTAAPLTQLLYKNRFMWPTEVEFAF